MSCPGLHVGSSQLGTGVCGGATATRTPLRRARQRRSATRRTGRGRAAATQPLTRSKQAVAVPRRRLTGPSGAAAWHPGPKAARALWRHMSATAPATDWRVDPDLAILCIARMQRKGCRAPTCRARSCCGPSDTVRRLLLLRGTGMGNHQGAGGVAHLVWVGSRTSRCSRLTARRSRMEPEETRHPAGASLTAAATRCARTKHTRPPCQYCPPVRPVTPRMQSVTMVQRLVPAGRVVPRASAPVRSVPGAIAPIGRRGTALRASSSAAPTSENQI